MKGVDLREFQFDWDLTWAVVFKNADGAVYGRFGTRAGARGNQLTHVSLPAFHRAIERALEIHRGYPANRSQLAGKRGPSSATACQLFATRVGPGQYYRLPDGVWRQRNGNESVPRPSHCG